MISGLEIMIFGFFMILNRFEIMSEIKGIGIKCLSLGGVVKGLMLWGVGKGILKDGSDDSLRFSEKITQDVRESKCSHFNQMNVENNSVNCPFSGHGVQILDKTCPFSGHGVHFLDTTKSLIFLTLK